MSNQTEETFPCCKFLLFTNVSCQYNISRSERQNLDNIAKRGVHLSYKGNDVNTRKDAGQTARVTTLDLKLFPFIPFIYS